LLGEYRTGDGGRGDAEHDDVAAVARLEHLHDRLAALHGRELRLIEAYALLEKTREARRGRWLGGARLENRA